MEIQWTLSFSSTVGIIEMLKRIIRGVIVMGPISLESIPASPVAPMRIKQRQAAMRLPAT